MYIIIFVAALFILEKLKSTPNSVNIRKYRKLCYMKYKVVNMNRFYASVSTWNNVNNITFIK